MDNIIRGERLTNFEISPDGSRFCMNVADSSGHPLGLSLPAECLISLVMTLPKIASQALKLRFNDDSLRLVYPLGAVHLETSQVEEITILTLCTNDGFAISFGFSADDLTRLEGAVREIRTTPRPKFIKN